MEISDKILIQNQCFLWLRDKYLVLRQKVWVVEKNKGQSILKFYLAKKN
jgi:hypothetical protein